MKTCTWLVVIGLLVCSPVLAGKQSKNESAKDKDIRMLLNLTGAGGMGVQVAKQLLANLKKAVSDVPAGFWTEFSQELRPEELTEMVVPIYAKHLTHSEVKQLIKFYSTPVGKKLIKVQPQIMQESMKAGEAWGQQIAARVVQKLKRRGISDRDPLTGAGLG